MQREPASQSPQPPNGPSPGGRIFATIAFAAGAASIGMPAAFYLTDEKRAVLVLTPFLAALGSVVFASFAKGGSKSLRTLAFLLSLTGIVVSLIYLLWAFLTSLRLGG